MGGTGATTMKAARITRPGGPEVIEIAEVPVPSAGDADVLVRVRASALNRADLLQRAGRYPAPPGWPADIPGLEIAGEVSGVGPHVTQWAKGDRVFGIVGGGGNAEYVVTRASHLARVPASLTWEQAAAVPEAFITAHDALLQSAMQPGERVLVHAVGSGVGLAAIQLVRALGGTAYGTARSSDKIARAREYGLTDGLVAGDAPALLAQAVRGWTKGAGVNVVLDLAGGPYLALNIECAAPMARIMVIGLVAGRTAASVDLGAVLTKRLTIRGTALRSRSDGEKAAVTAAFARDVVPLLASGAVRPVVDRVFPLSEISAAHALMESNATFGKLVLTH